MPKGGWVGKENSTNVSVATGVWGIEEISYAKTANRWPTMNPYAAGTIARFLRDMSAGTATWTLAGGASVDVENTILSGTQTINASTNWGDATPDTRATAVRIDGDLTIGSSATITTQVRKKGLYILVRGNCTINGALTMTARGASAAAPSAALDVIANYTIPATGQSAATATANAAGARVPFATGGQTGGGAGGGGQSNGANSVGAAGTAWSGGSGGGGTGAPAGGNGATNGGAGGVGGAGDQFGRGGGGGGAGNSGGAGGAAGTGGGALAGNAGSNGTGGTIVLIVEGTLTVSSTGTITAEGSAGGSAPGTNANSGGGGSGGGSVNIFHSGISLATATQIRSWGGEGGTTSVNYMSGASVGAIGGDGSVRHNRLNKGSLSYTTLYAGMQAMANGSSDGWLVNNELLPVEGAVLTGNQTLSTNTNWGTSEPDIMTLVRVQGDLTINNGVTLTTSARKRGLAVLVQGNLVINGTVHMNGKSAWAENLANPLVLYTGVTVGTGAAGGTGGAPVNGSNLAGVVGNAGSAATASSGLAGGGGGGGSGATSYTCQSARGGTGGTGRMWGGGSGAGGSGYAHNGSGTQTQWQDYDYDSGNRYHSGSGWRGFTDGRGGMGGAPYHDGTYSYQHPLRNLGGWAYGNGNGVLDTSGPGGMIYFFVVGNVTIGATGAIQSTGSAATNIPAWNSGNSNYYASPGGGAGSGGGACTILYTGSYSNTGSTNFAGGAGGLSGRVTQGGFNFYGGDGGAGGAGSLRTATFAG